MSKMFTAALIATLVLTSFSAAVEARPVGIDRSDETSWGSVYDVPHELRHWYDRNYPNG